MYPIRVAFGTRFYGKVDHVPGLFHVATRFFHIQFFPLIPTGSYLVLEELKGLARLKFGCGGKSELLGDLGPSRTGDRCVKIGWSAKSVSLGWLRAILCCALAVCPAALCSGFAWKRWSPGSVPVIGLVGAAGAIGALLWLSYRMTRASPLRALELAGRAEIAPEMVAQFFAHSISSKELESIAEANRLPDSP